MGFKIFRALHTAGANKIDSPHPPGHRRRLGPSPQSHIMQLKAKGRQYAAEVPFFYREKHSGKHQIGNRLPAFPPLPDTSECYRFSSFRDQDNNLVSFQGLAASSTNRTVRAVKSLAQASFQGLHPVQAASHHKFLFLIPAQWQRILSRVSRIIRT